MLDWQGELVEHKHSQKIVLSEVQEDIGIAYASFIGSVESTTVTKLLDEYNPSNEEVMPRF